MTYDSRIHKTNNKVKATWDIIKTATNNKTSNKTTSTSEIKKIYPKKNCRCL